MIRILINEKEIKRVDAAFDFFLYNIPVRNSILGKKSAGHFSYLVYLFIIKVSQGSSVRYS